MKNKHILLWFKILHLFFLSSLQVYAQEDPEKDRHIYFGNRLHYGSLILHSAAIKDIGKAYPKGMELTIGWHSTSQSSWDACNCFPKTGLIFDLWDFDKPKILGYGFSVISFIEPVFGAEKKFSFSVRAGTGISYLTKPYDPETNPLNQAYSTMFAFPLLLGVSEKIQLSPKLNLNLNLVYNHISNGGLRQPNKGINWPSVSLGLDYSPLPYQFPSRKITDWHLIAEKRHHTAISFFATAKLLKHGVNIYYPIAGADAIHIYRISRLSQLIAGLEIICDGVNKYKIQQEPDLDVDFKKVGFMAGHGFPLGRFTFNQAIGVYLYDPYKAKDPVYQRYGLNFKINRNWQTGISLLAHRHEADFLDLRLGWRF